MVYLDSEVVQNIFRAAWTELAETVSPADPEFAETLAHMVSEDIAQLKVSYASVLGVASGPAPRPASATSAQAGVPGADAS